jgi:Oligopeptide/dipeptide transporter, C-terminal region
LKERERPLLTIPGTVPPPQEFGSGCRFKPRCAAATAECSADRPMAESGRLQAWCHHPLHGTARHVGSVDTANPVSTEVPSGQSGAAGVPR